MSNPIPSQNLLNRTVSRSSVSVRSPGFVRKALLNLISIAAAIAIGFCYSRYLDNTLPLWWTVLSFSVFAVISSIQMLLNSDITNRMLIIFVEVVGMLIFFRTIPLKLLASTALLAYIIFMWGEFESRNELENNVHIRFFAIAGPLVGKLLTGVILLMILVYLPRIDQGQPFMSQQTFELFYKTSVQSIGRFYDGLRFDSSVGNFVEDIVKPQLEADSRFRQLPEAKQAEAVRTATNEMISGFSKSWGFAIQSNDSLSQAFYQFVIATLNGWRNSFGDKFLIGWTLIVFLLVRSIGFIFSWLLLLAGSILYQILLALDVLKVLGENSTKERIFFS